MTSQAYKLHVSNIGELWQYFRILLCNDETFWGCLTYLSSFMWSHPVLYHRNGSGTRQQSSLSLRNLISYVIHWRQLLPKYLWPCGTHNFISTVFQQDASCSVHFSRFSFTLHSLKFGIFSFYNILQVACVLHCYWYALHGAGSKLLYGRVPDPFLLVQNGVWPCEAGTLS